MENITKYVEAKINAFTTHEERQAYLTGQIRRLEKRIIDFKAFDKPGLDALKEITAKDYKAYTVEMYSGKPIYWYPKGSKYEHLNEKFAKGCGIENLDLLLKRINLEVRYDLMKADLKLFKNLQKKVNDTSQSTKSKLEHNETNTEKYNAKHYLLAYLFECNAKGESYPIGNKKELERIGNERMGTGKGNRFYKVFNEIINKDLNAENNLFEIGGEYWRKAVIELSKAPELVEKYLQSKQL